MEENTNVELDTVTNQEEVVEEVVTDERDAEIAELKEKLKNKSIESRLAKKETKEPVIDSSYEERLTRAELKAEGIKDDDEMKFIIDSAKKMGVDPVDALKDDVIQGLLQRTRTQKSAEIANPTSTSRGSINVKNKPEYWADKGEYPTDVELRRKVVNLEIARAKSSSKFIN